MTFLDNMEILKNSFPDIWQTMTEIQDSLDTGMVQNFTNKKGISNLKVGKQFIHDKGDPHQEARQFIGQFQNVADHSDILFYGLGMGYQIKAFLEQHPDTPFSIYEPVPEVFYQFLCHSDLNELPFRLLKNIYLESKPEDLETYSTNIVAAVRSSILIIELPTYQSIFSEKRAAFFTRFGSLIEERRHSITTFAAFQKRWTINSVKNFIQVVNTPNIVLEKQGFFQNKPAVMVASGPTLEDEIENLRTIKERGLAYIFSVGTAVNTLIQHGIYPDATCTYDPSEENQLVFKDIREKGIQSIPLIFGSTVGYETLENYPGPQVHMLISQDALAAFYLKPENQGGLEFISDGSTIAVVTLQLLYKLGFNPIILAGLNLAFRDGMQYAAGSTFFPLEASQADMEKPFMVRDVYGNEVASSYSLNGMRRQFESYLEHYNDVEVINTTQYGAHIEGTRFQSLVELIDNRLYERVVEDNWLECMSSSYDINHLMKQHHIMTSAYNDLPRLMEQCEANLEAINQTAETQDARLIGQSYDHFNLSMANLRDNRFFATLIEPMNRVEMQFLMLAVPEISLEQNSLTKARMMEREFGSFLEGCEKDIQRISPLFQEVDAAINEYYSEYMIHSKAARIKILLMDGDGILTNGAIYFSSSGDELRKFNSKDRIGLLRLREQGMECLLINPEDNPILKTAALKLGIDIIFPGNKEQIMATLAEQYQPEEVACIWSELSDLSLLKQVGLSFTVKEAAPRLKDEVDYVLIAGGGEGVILEIADLLVKVCD